MTTFARLFGDRDRIDFQVDDVGRRVRALGQLVRASYIFVRPKDDLFHEGTYSPDTRDDAQTARNFLLSALLETPGAEACEEVMGLAAEPAFAHFPDRLRHLARQRAAQDTEFPAFDAAALRDLEARCEAPPHDRDGLFDVMIDRLGDLAHDFAAHDFTDRRTMRTITEEVEMQSTLSWRLQGKSNGAFTITREDEVADQKRTDLRFSAIRGDQKAVAEVKIADDRWSVADLQHAIRHQLVGQYLRHDQCKAGCLLLTFNGTKSYWLRPRTDERLDFAGLVGYLNANAQAIAAEHQHHIRLAVVGIDLTDPFLVPAHRRKAA